MTTRSPLHTPNDFRLGEAADHSSAGLVLWVRVHAPDLQIVTEEQWERVQQRLKQIGARFRPMRWSWP
jgi:DNA-binding transcriptional regulator/RsmH inhibitor MraZ